LHVLCCFCETAARQFGFFVFERAIENACKIKEIQIDVALKIKYKKLNTVLHYKCNLVQYVALKV